jgi:hypothetical protein
MRQLHLRVAAPPIQSAGIVERQTVLTSCCQLLDPSEVRLHRVGGTTLIGNVTLRSEKGGKVGLCSISLAH